MKGLFGPLAPKRNGEEAREKSRAAEAREEKTHTPVLIEPGGNR